ncbi:MAG: hypothetical protein K6A23_10850 [Butyrivibrio sp.]|nr:hypothetical protein [Butyrivibrio sp.]
MKKNFLTKIMLLTACTLVLTKTSVVAAEKNTIPEEMQPYTVIQYQDDTTYSILKGGEVRVKSNVLDEKKSADELALEKESKKDGSYYLAPTEEYPEPIAGRKVTYGSEAQLSDIIMPETPVKKAYALKAAAAEVAAGGKADKRVLIAQWGTNNYNKLYRQGNKIIGYGRATTYADKNGQRDNKLKKGDVATKLKYDNCSFGLRVDVKAHIKGSSEYKTCKMYKRDAGGLPNAIVDIWKTGVEYWGYKYSENLSLPGKTRIIHDNKKD